MSNNMPTIADWMIFQNPLYMGRIIRSRTRGGVNFIVEEANENQNRKWFALNFIDETDDFEGLEKFTHRILLGRHKLLSKHNQLKYAEDFYASINNDKIKQILGQEFSALGGQWVQVDGFENTGSNYAWLVLSPWGKIWISRLAILCLALAITDNFTTSDIEDHPAISSNDRPQPKQTFSSSSLHSKRQGDFTITDNDTIVSAHNPTRRFKTNATDIEIQHRFKNLYGLEKYASVRGDSLWNPDAIGKTLGRTAVTGLMTMATGGGYWGFGTSALNQMYQHKRYLDASVQEKIKQQSQDLYDCALSITEIVNNMHNPTIMFAATKLREAVDDFRRTMPGRFNGQAYNPQSMYYGDSGAVKQKYRGIFAQSSGEVKVPEKSQKDKMLGISQKDDSSLIDLERLPESAALGVKSYLSKGRPGFKPASWLGAAVPMLSSVAEKYWMSHNPMGPAHALETQVKNMKEILGEIRVLAREYDQQNHSGLYEEIKTATNVVHSFIKRIESSMPQSQGEPAGSNNLIDMTGSDKVYP